MRPQSRADRRTDDILGMLAAVVVALVGAAPWIFGFAAGTDAAAAGLPFALGFLAIAILAPALRPASFLLGFGGAWVLVSPWIVGYAEAGVAAWAVDAVLGVALITLGIVTAARTVPLDPASAEDEAGGKHRA